MKIKTADEIRAITKSNLEVIMAAIEKTALQGGRELKLNYDEGNYFKFNDDDLNKLKNNGFKITEIYDEHGIGCSSYIVNW